MPPFDFQPQSPRQHAAQMMALQFSSVTGDDGGGVGASDINSGDAGPHASSHDVQTLALPLLHSPNSAGDVNWPVSHRLFLRDQPHPSSVRQHRAHGVAWHGSGASVGGAPR